MGVYVKGMKMPKMCLWCPFRYVGSCPTGKTNVNFDLGGRPDACPLVEVQEPHGELIDASKIIMCLADYQLQESPVWGSNGYGNADKYEAITDCIYAVESAHTVIEAEGKEK